MDTLVVELRDAVSGHFTEEKKSDENCKEGSSALSTSEREAAALEAKPLQVKKTVCYIVSGVVIKDGRVLMMREAKRSCRGLWYLPAGRVEINETLVDGVKREVLEETGLIFEPTSVISIEYSTLDWFRFNFIGKITGGNLKKTADQESLEAGWFKPFHIFNQLPLRARDICPIIEAALHWKETKMGDPLFNILPHQRPHSRISIQLIVISKQETGIHILIDKESVKGFLKITPTTSIPVNLANYVHNIVKGKLVATPGTDMKVHGIMNIEHNGGPCGVADGMELTFLVEVISPPPPSSSSSSDTAPLMASQYKWCLIDNEVLCTKVNKLSKMGCIRKWL